MIDTAKETRLKVFDIYKKKLDKFDNKKCLDFLNETFYKNFSFLENTFDKEDCCFYRNILNNVFLSFACIFMEKHKTYEELRNDCITKTIAFVNSGSCSIVYKELFEQGVIVYDGHVEYDNFLKEWRKEKRNGLSAKTRYEVIVRDNSTCQLCGAKPKNSQLHVDHIVPVALGGDNNLQNLRVLCSDCNLGKNDSDLEIAEPISFSEQRKRHIDFLMNGYILEN